MNVINDIRFGFQLPHLNFYIIDSTVEKKKSLLPHFFPYSKMFFFSKMSILKLGFNVIKYMKIKFVGAKFGDVLTLLFNRYLERYFFFNLKHLCEEKKLF